MYVNKCIKCGTEFETKNPKRVICPNCLYPDKNMMPSGGDSDNQSGHEHHQEEQEQQENKQQNYNYDNGYSGGGSYTSGGYSSGGYSAGGYSAGGYSSGGYDRPQRNNYNQSGGYQSRGGYQDRSQSNYQSRGGYQQRNNYNQSGAYQSRGSYQPRGGGYQDRNQGGYQQRSGYNQNRSQGGYQSRGGYNSGRPQNNFQQRRPGGVQRRSGAGRPQRPQQPKQLLVSKEQLEQIELLYKAMLPLPNPDAHEVIGEKIGLEPKKVFFGINLIRQKMMLPKLPFPKRKLAISPDQLMAIRSLYEPLLPLPPIGCHKIIAIQLKMDEWRVHVGIGLIRAQMGLDRWNPDREDAPEEFKKKEVPAPSAEKETKPKKTTKTKKAKVESTEESEVVAETSEETPKTEKKTRGRKPKKADDEE